MIAAVGIYGVMAYATQQRSAEMAIRMALGSSAERIFLLVVKDGLRLTALGAATGMVLGLVFGRYIKSLLFGIESTDAVTLGLAVVVALITGMAASVLPRAERREWELRRRCDTARPRCIIALSLQDRARSTRAIR